MAIATTEARERGCNERSRLASAGASEAVLDLAAHAVDTLCAEIHIAGTSKLAALEVDAVVAERVLEKLVDALHAVAAYACVTKALSPVLCFANIVELAENCRDVELQSVVPAQPTTFALSAPTGDIPLGHLCAPGALCASSVCMRSAALAGHAEPGLPVHAQFVLSAAYAIRCSEEASAALTWLGTRASVYVTLEGDVLPVRLTVNLEQGCIDVYIDVPPCAPLSTLHIELMIAAESVLVSQLPVPHGVVPPFVLDGVEPNDGASPVIALSGTIFLPVGGGDAVLVYNAIGNPLPGVDLALLGLSSSVEAAAFVEQASGILVLADENDVVAVDADSRAVIWRNHGAVRGCNGLAVLSAHGIIVASSPLDSAVVVFRISDGVRIFSFPLSGPRFMASDPRSSTVYVSTHAGVVELLWDGLRFTQSRVVPGTEHPSTAQPVAVMRRTGLTGTTISQLIVGKYGKSSLRVFSLPLLCLVADIDVPAGAPRVLGIAADPWGAAIAVVAKDKSGAGRVYVMEWPLLGVPALV